MKKILIFVFCFLLGLQTVLAHQPRLLSDEDTILVSQPEISKAYYGELKGDSVDYIIESEKNFNLYVNILVPDIEGATTDYMVRVTKDGQPFKILSPKSQEWEGFYEPFAGDDYLMGPEYDQTVDAGTYSIKVSSPDNEGKYVLAIGKIESFPASEIFNTIISLPELKTDFFNKPFWLIYYNYVGLFLLGIILIFGIIVYLVYRIVHAKIKSKKSKKQK